LDLENVLIRKQDQSQYAGDATTSQSSTSRGFSKHKKSGRRKHTITRKRGGDRWGYGKTTHKYRKRDLRVYQLLETEEKNCTIEEPAEGRNSQM